MNETEIREEPQAGSPLCDADGHAWVWTWPIEGGEGSVGQCSLCGRITTAERDAAARTEVARLREAVETLADGMVEVAYMQIATEEMLTVQPTGPFSAVVPVHWRAAAEERAGHFAGAVRALLAPVVPSGGAESGEALDRVTGKPATAYTPPEDVVRAAPVSSGGQAERRKARAKAAADRLRADVEAAGGAEQLRRLASLDAGGQADGEGEGRPRVVDEGDLLTLPIRSVIAGPIWHSEVYLKAGPDEWYAPAQPDEWTSRTLSHRGPFVVLRLGDEPLAARPVLSREALRERLNGHFPVSHGCVCGEWKPSVPGYVEFIVQYLDHLADVLAGEQR